VARTQGPRLLVNLELTLYRQNPEGASWTQVASNADWSYVFGRDARDLRQRTQSSGQLVHRRAGADSQVPDFDRWTPNHRPAFSNRAPAENTSPPAWLSG
jgi:hypothetical protein